MRPNVVPVADERNVDPSVRVVTRCRVCQTRVGRVTTAP
jgi:hypothetical protein